MGDAQFPSDTFPRQQARTRRYTLGTPADVHRGRGRVAGGVPAVAGERRSRRLPLGLRRRGRGPSGWSSIPRAGRRAPLRRGARSPRATPRVAHRASPTTPPIARCSVAAFAMDGGLHVADLVNGGARPLRRRTPRTRSIRGPIRRDDASRTSRTARSASSTWTARTTGSSRRDPDPDVSWGLAEFVAAEEMERQRGYWWSPDGGADRGRSCRRTPCADLAHRGTGRSRGPAACGPLSAARAPTTRSSRSRSSTSTADASTSRGTRGLPVPRDGRVERARPADVAGRVAGSAHDADPARRSDTGRPTLVREDHDERWLDITVGVPAWLADGRLVRTLDSDDTKRLTFDDEPVTPVGPAGGAGPRRRRRRASSARTRTRPRRTSGGWTPTER